MQLRHIGIVCKDLDVALNFYIKWFECSISRRMNESGHFLSTILNMKNAQITTVKLDFPEKSVQIELLHFQSPHMTESVPTLQSQGITHFAIKVGAIDSLYKNMSAEGVFFLSKPQLSDDGLAKVCFCRDPNGVYLELVEINK